MKGLIISSGRINDYSILKSLIAENDYILCADGGLDHIMKLGKIPHLLLGDFDSISREGVAYIRENNVRVERFPSIKDNTDTELAIIYLIERGFTDITLTGGTGSRLDHTMANLFLLRRFNRDGVRLTIVDDNNMVNLVVDKFRVKKSEKQFVSIIPINDEGIIVSLKGFKYPLEDEYIEFGFTLGVSNEVVDSYGFIELKKGEALVFQSFD